MQTKEEEPKNFIVMKIEMIVERTKTGYSAFSKKYPVYTVGLNLEEPKVNMLEALNLFLRKKEK